MILPGSLKFLIDVDFCIYALKAHEIHMKTTHAGVKIILYSETGDFGTMKKLFMLGCISCMMMLAVSSCAGSAEESESNIAYGRVLNTDEKTITVEDGSYSYGKEFRANGEEITYNLPESVFFDDFRKGDIVAILFDGKDATAVTNVKYVKDGRNEDKNVSEGMDSIVKADNEEKMLSDEDYSSSEDNTAGILALNPDGRFDISRISVSMEGEGSVGLASQAGGHVDGDQISISTAGSGSSPVKAYDESSIIDITDGNLETSGENSPCVYSAGNVSLSGVTAVSRNSGSVEIKNGGVVNIKDSNVTAYSGPAVNASSEGENDEDKNMSKVTVSDSSLRSEDEAALIRVSGAEVSMRFIQSTISCSGGILADITEDENGNGGKLLMYGVGQTLNGELKCDSKSKVKLVLSEGSRFTGSVDSEDSAYYSKIYISGDSRWELTEDSYTSSIVNEQEDCSNIESNGHNIYYDSDRLANEWLGGKTISLKGGGVLTPAEQMR